MSHFCWSCLISSLLISSLSTSFPPWTVSLNLFSCFFEKIYRTIFLCTNLSIIYLLVYLSRYRPLHQSLYISIPLPHSVLLSFLPVSFPPPTVSTYLTTFLFSYINLIKIVFFSYINIIEILYVFYIRVGLNTPLMPCYWVISLFFLLQDFSLTLPS